MYSEPKLPAAPAEGSWNWRKGTAQGGRARSPDAFVFFGGGKVSRQNGLNSVRKPAVFLAWRTRELSSGRRQPLGCKSSYWKGEDRDTESQITCVNSDQISGRLWSDMCAGRAADSSAGGARTKRFELPPQNQNAATVIASYNKYVGKRRHSSRSPTADIHSVQSRIPNYSRYEETGKRNSGSKGKITNANWPW